MTRTRLLIRGTLAAALLEGGWLATPAAAPGVIGTGSGRAGANVAAVMALIGVLLGRLALVRSSRTG